MLTEETDVAVVGAGGGGAVLALAKQGISMVVLDQAVGLPKGLRGEILQPNWQQVLDRLGVLASLPADATRSVRRVHFCRAGGTRLCSIDCGDLPTPYNQAIVTLPNVALHAFTGLLREGDRVFQTLDRNARLRYQVLSTTAGLRTTPPFQGIDRVIAAGLFPDVCADERSHHSMSS